jgi:hypothetical protein
MSQVGVALLSPHLQILAFHFPSGIPRCTEEWEVRGEQLSHTFSKCGIFLGHRKDITDSNEKNKKENEMSVYAVRAKGSQKTVWYLI